MQVVSRIVRCRELLRFGRITQRAIEIHYPIEITARANPFVDPLASLIPSVGVIHGTLKRQQGSPDHLDAMQMSTDNDLPVGRDECVCVDGAHGVWISRRA